MKIGILTYHCAHNYGAMLQAYAMLEYLRSLGYEVSVIDYTPAFLTVPYRWFFPKSWLPEYDTSGSLKSHVKECLLTPLRIKRYRTFTSFIRNYFPLYQMRKNDDFSGFDAVLIGSDQVWRKTIHGGQFDPLYFGQGMKCRVFSYAASAGINILDEEDRTFFKNSLRNFFAVGVREESLRELLQPLTEKQVETTLDPVLLAGEKIMNKIASSVPVPSKYVLYYDILRQTSACAAFASHISKQLNADIVGLTGHIFWKKNDASIHFAAGPEEFVSLIRNAECIVTNSFHGLAFSLIFNKPFYSLMSHQQIDVRQWSILQKLGLEERFVDNKDRPIFSPVDFSAANWKLQEEAEKSAIFLQQALR
ncbi:MAG: polysaccharide pyruvyl transferase family protein [Lentisphaeria bacterium]|nr:polysaccharide pyruvyl transferase family protein [Lentisphaeria bacterium]